MLILTLLNACKDDEKVEPALEDPNFDEFSIVQSITLENQEVPAFSSVIVTFNYPIGKETTLIEESVKYRPKFDSFIASGLSLSNALFTWNADSTQLTIEPELIWPVDTEIAFTVSANWERFTEEGWLEKSEDVVVSSFSIGTVPEIIGSVSIAEDDYLNIFENIQFNTQVSLDTKISNFSPFIEEVTILYKNNTIPSSLKTIQDTNLVEIIPESFFPETDRNEDMTLLIKADWKKKVNDEWVGIAETEETEINFGTRFDDIEIDFLPKKNEGSVSVYFNPSLSFNYQMGEPLELNDRVRPNYTVVRIEDNMAQELNADIVWSADKTSVRFSMVDLLPESLQIKLLVNVHWEKFVDQAWQSLGSDYETQYESTFYTNSITNSELIAISEFDYSYPYPFQINFLKGESGQGYIKLASIESDVENLTINTSSTDLFTVFRDNTSSYYKEVPLTYNQEEKQFDFEIPSDLPNDKMLLADLFGHDGTKPVSLTKIFFGTSFHNTLQEKINAMTILSGARRPLRAGVHELLKSYIEGEVFDEAEVNDLISLEAILEANDYFNNDIYPLIYDGIESGELSLTWRDGSQYGIVPKTAVYIRQYPSDKEASYIDFQNSIRPYITNIGAFIYNQVDIYEKDYQDLREQVSNISNSQRSGWMNLIMSSSFPSIKKGNYDFIIRYTLPGTGEITSEVQMSVSNPVD